jgi:uncharacterized membrane-anchored protein
MPTWTKVAARAIALAALLFDAGAATAQQPPQAPPPPEIEWTPGPAKVDVGESLAEVQLPESLAFTGAADARELLEAMGNPTDGSELAIVVPKAEDQDWFIIFEWHAIGYVKDEEKDEIDADAILASIREGTEEANEERAKRGLPALHVVGWAQPPAFDDRTKNLTWATIGRNDEGGESVNYNVRVLGREGVMSVTLVDDPKNLARAKPAVDEVLAAFSYKSGKRYAEWVPGDKVSEYGAKAGKLVVVVLAGLGALGVKFWNALRGKASARPAPRPGPDAGA